MSLGLFVSGSKKPAKKSKRPPQANVKLAADLVHKLGVISQWRQKSISIICDPQLRPFVNAEFDLVVKEMAEEAARSSASEPNEGS